MNGGWIKLFRQLLEHEFWREPRRFSNAEAWIDLLLSASHEDHAVPVGTEVVSVKRGQVLTSQRKLAQRWSWDRETVSRYLKLCLKLDQICPIETSRKTSHGYTLITIRNYGKYQDQQNADATTDATANATIKPATMPPPMPHNQEVKNGKKKEGTESGGLIPQSLSSKRSRKLTRSDPPQAAAFECFYSAYPRHVAKQKAIKAWLKLNPDSETVAKIMAGTLRYAAEVEGTEAKYISYPATWLNDRRWEDEPNITGNSNRHGKPAEVKQLENGMVEVDGRQMDRATFERRFANAAG